MAATQVPATSTPACVRCGLDAEYDFGEVWLCLECYHVAGSTCAGVGRPTAPSDPTC